MCFFTLLFLWPSPGIGHNATEVITLTFEAGRENTSIKLHPVGKQGFVQTSMNGLPLVAMLREKGENNTNWYFDIIDPRCSNTLGDGVLIVDHIASDANLRWLTFDSAFHEYHRFPASQFPDDRNRDGGFNQLLIESFSLNNEITRIVFPMRKTRFSRRAENGSDFFLHPDLPGFVGLRRITLRFKPIDPNPAFPPVDLSRLLEFFMKALWNRAPEAREIRIYQESFAKHELHLFPLLQRLLYSSEFRDKNFLPFENSKAIRRLLQLTCGREPTSGQFNTFVVETVDSRLDFGTRAFVEKFYSEMIEHALTSIRRKSQ